MNKQEFISKLSKLYKEGNSVKYELLEEWIDRLNLKDFQLQILFEEFTEKYKYKVFPTLAEIVEAWEGKRNSLPGDYKNEVFAEIQKQREQSKEETPEIILRKCRLLRKKNQDGIPLNSLEMDYLYQWDDLLSEVSIAKDKKLPPTDIGMRAAEVKNCIARHKKIVRIGEVLNGI